MLSRGTCIQDLLLMRAPPGDFLPFSIAIRSLCGSSEESEPPALPTDAERMLNATGQVLVVWLPTKEGFATSTIRLGTRPPKRNIGKRKCPRLKPIWLKCENFVDYLESVAGLSFLAAFGEWYNAHIAVILAQAFDAVVRSWSRPHMRPVRSADGCLPGFVRLPTSQPFWLRRLAI